MDKSNTVNILSRDIAAIETQLNQLNSTISLLSENLDGIKKNVSLLLEEHEFMARELTKDSIKVIQLKNGQVNVPYEESIIFEHFNIPKEGIIDFNGIDQLQWNQDEQRFEGHLTQAGEFCGKLIFWKNEMDKANDGTTFEREVHILVNPDPNSLWVNIPPPADGPFFKENSAYRFEKTETRTLLGASIRGKSHAQKGTFRDDDFDINTWNNGWVLQTVSDGAGSAKYSREGSRIACQSVCAKISAFMESDKCQQLEDVIGKLNSNKSEKNHQSDAENTANNTAHDHEKAVNSIELEQAPLLPSDNEIQDVLRKELSDLIHELTVKPAYFAFQEIKRIATDADFSIKAFASTILFALSKEFEFGTIVISYSIGDGAIGVITDKEGVLLMTPDGGEYSGQTRFVTMQELFKTEDVYKRSNLRLFTDKVEAIMLMTDGISDPKFGTDNNLQNSKLWLNFWEELKPVLSNADERRILEWMNFHEKGEYDDRTLTLLY